MKHFYALSEPNPGQAWLAHFQAAWPSYQYWFQSQHEFLRPDLIAARSALAKYMPEMLPLWEKLCLLTGSDSHISRCLTFYNPPALVTGGTQAVWQRYPLVLVRNFNYPPQFSEGRILLSHWHNTRVIAMTDCLWGALDGMNEHGLCISYVHGGDDTPGQGFAIALIIRYLLEFCKNTLEAIEKLCQIPCACACNVTITDSLGLTRTVELSPLTPAVIKSRPFALNHQGGFSVGRYGLFPGSFEREQLLMQKLSGAGQSVDALIESFAYPPFFEYADHACPTLYTVVYNPVTRACEYRWPHRIRLVESFDQFYAWEGMVSYD